jgi:hypothetical protein
LNVQGPIRLDASIFTGCNPIGFGRSGERVANTSASGCENSGPLRHELDQRLGWAPIPRLQISVVGQNLLHARHEEFGAPATAQSIERGVFAKAMWGF